MNWEKEFKEWFQFISYGYIGSTYLSSLERGKALVQQAIDEALTVVPMTDPPLDDDELEVLRKDMTTPLHPYDTLFCSDTPPLFDMIDWQRAVIAHMAKDNGYQDGVEAGKREWNRENYEWISRLEDAGITSEGMMACPDCKKHMYPSYVHSEGCPLAKYLRENRK